MNRTFRFNRRFPLALQALACLWLAVCPAFAADEAATAAAGEAAGAAAEAAQQPAADDRSYTPATLTGDFKAAYVIDADTGFPLVAFHERELRQPASMLKMMTELLVLDRVAKGDLSLEEMVTVSGKASKMGGSQVYLKHGEQFPVRDLLMALAIHSANDAAAALAEHVAGSTEAFIDLMNMKAKELGMTDTEFHSVHGLPPGRAQEPDMTSARDMAILGRTLIQYPNAVEWASTKTAPFRGGDFTLFNPNKLVGKYRGLDGIKTGYTGPAGFCVTASAVQMGKRLISVVMGCSTDNARATETTRLLTYGFNMYVQVEMIPAGGTILATPYKVKGGRSKTAELAYAGPLIVSAPRGRESKVELELRLPEQLQAPLAVGTEVGRAVAVLDGRELGSVAVVTAAEVLKGNWVNRLFNK